MTKEEAVKALPTIRLVHGGNYGEWAKDAGVADAGASNGAGLHCIIELNRQLRKARKQLNEKPSLSLSGRALDSWHPLSTSRSRQ